MSVASYMEAGSSRTDGLEKSLHALAPQLCLGLQECLLVHRHELRALVAFELGPDRRWDRHERGGLTRECGVFSAKPNVAVVLGQVDEEFLKAVPFHR